MKAKFFFLFALIIVCIEMSGCGTIQSHRVVEQPTGSVLTTGIGGTIFRLNKKGDLPNAYGGRDIWGGKIDKGFAEIKLVSINGTVLGLEIFDVNKDSSETTMDRYDPFGNKNADINVDVDTNVTIGNTPQPKSYFVSFDTAKQKDIVISGVRVTFLEVQPYSIKYTLDDVQP